MVGFLVGFFAGFLEGLLVAFLVGIKSPFLRKCGAVKSVQRKKVLGGREVGLRSMYDAKLCIAT